MQYLTYKILTTTIFLGGHPSKFLLYRSISVTSNQSAISFIWNFFLLHTLLALRQLSLSFACTVKTTWMEVAFYIAPGKDFVKERRVALYLESSSLCVPLLFWPAKLDWLQNGSPPLWSSVFV